MRKYLEKEPGNDTIAEFGAWALKIFAGRERFLLKIPPPGHNRGIERELEAWRHEETALS